MIIICGPDNSGKTTLARRLANEFDLTYHRGTKGPSTDYDFWMETLVSPPEVLAQGVWDRFFYGELVYGPLCRDKIKLSNHQREVIHSMMITAQPLIIRCELIPMEDMFNERPQEVDWATTLQANMAYRRLLPLRTAYQFNALEGGEATIKINNRVMDYLQSMITWKELRSACLHGRGQLHQPPLMLVGQKFARDNKWRVPFERSKSAVILHSALRKASISMDQVWFTNAIKSDAPITVQNLEKLEREVELIQPEKIIALGNRASGLLSILSVVHTKIPHPAHYLRRLGLEKARSVFYERFVAIAT